MLSGGCETDGVLLEDTCVLWRLIEDAKLILLPS